MSLIFLGNPRVQPWGAMFPTSRASSRPFTASASGLLSGPALPSSTSHFHNCHLRSNQVREHQTEDEQQTRKPHVSHRVQQLHQAARGSATAGCAGAVAGDGPGGLLPSKTRECTLCSSRTVRSPHTLAPRELNRGYFASRGPLIESLLFYDRDARRDLFFYFPRGRPAPPAACDIRTIFHNFLYSRSLRRCVNLSIGAIISRVTRRRFIFVLFKVESTFGCLRSISIY